MSLAVLGGAVVLRALRSDPWMEVAGNVAMGIGGQALINTCIGDGWKSRVQQLALASYASQPALFAVTEWFNSTQNRAVQQGCIGAIGAMLGAGLALYGKELIDRRGILLSESEPGDSTGNKFHDFFDSEKMFLWIVASKVAACVACFGASLVVTNPLWMGITSFGLTYYMSELAGQVLSEVVDYKITNQPPVRAGEEEGEFTGLPQSRWRMAKAAISTAGFFAVPLSWTPRAKESFGSATQVPLPFVGIINGLCEGFAYRSQERRFRNIPIDQLEELGPRSEKKMHWIARIAVPLLALGGLSWYVFTQNGKPQDQWALRSLYAGAVWVFAKNGLTEWKWDLEKRREIANPDRKQRLLDQAVLSQYSPRLLGISPAILYFLVENSMSLRGGQELSTAEMVALIVGLHAYGQGMADEWWKAWSERKGNIFLFPLMMMMNALWTQSKVVQGEVYHG
jgi:hypothetical protein